MLNLEHLLRVPYLDSANDFDLLPDGTKVAFAWNVSGQWEIYELRLDGQPVPRLVTRGPGGKFGPQYSPDGRRLAYAMDPDGGEAFHLWVHDLAGGQAADLTPENTSALQPGFAWSPDGAEIAFLSDISGCFSLYILPAGGGQARPVFAAGCPAESVSWSPDGRWLAVTAEMRGQDHGIFIVPAGGGAASLIGGTDRPMNAHGACWSPDSTRVAFASDLGGDADIGICEIASGEIRWLTAGAWDKGQPVWAPDATRLSYVLSRGAVTWLAVQKVGEAPALYQVEPGVHASPRFTPDGRGLLFIFDSPRRPPDLWALDLERGAFRQLTRSLPAGLEEAEFVIPEEIRYPGLDGQSVPALLYRPAAASGPAPAVVNVHGGPDWLYQLGWNPVMAHLASRGWAVLAPNYRGSTGYGRAWRSANRLDLGGGDADDVAAGARHLVRAGIADAARLAVTGRSHGGYLTMVCLTRQTELWAAGSAVVPFLNWFTSHANAREDVQHWNIEILGTPEEHRELWYARSPFFFLDRVRVPVQLICGGHDPRCPASESLEARARLLTLGQEVDFVLYPDEGHSFLKTENVVEADLRRVAFLARALEKD